MSLARKRTFIATLGFNESLVLATKPTFGSENFDKLIIITSKDSFKQTLSAIKVIARLVESFRFTGKTIDLEKIYVEETEFKKNLSTLQEIIMTEASENREIYINLSGGMRILVITLFMAALLSQQVITTIMISPENQKGIKTLELPKIHSIQFEEENELSLSRFFPK
jgi:CRISPR locus-related DNA-binding protein